jgi:hypothetical protein
MLFGVTVAVYCENHTEHTDTVCTSQEPYGTYRYCLYLTGTIRNTQIQSVPHRNHTEHTDTVRTSQEPYGTQSVPHRNHTEHTDTVWAEAEVQYVRAGGLIQHS